MNANELRHDLTLIEENGFGADADADSTIKEAAVAYLKLLEDRFAEDMESLARFPLSDWQYEVANGDTKRGYDDWVLAQVESEPVPWRYDGDYYIPVVTSQGSSMTVEVGFPNEEPDTEDDRWLEVKFTSEGIIIDAYVSEDQLVDSRGMTYKEWFDSFTGGNI